MMSYFSSDCSLEPLSGKQSLEPCSMLEEESANAVL